MGKDEALIHSIKFEGDSTKEIGLVDKEDTEDENRKGRVERFTMQPNEKLLGVEMFHDTAYVYGIRWLKLRVPASGFTASNSHALPAPTDALNQ